MVKPLSAEKTPMVQPSDRKLLRALCSMIARKPSCLASNGAHRGALLCVPLANELFYPRSSITRGTLLSEKGPIGPG